MSKKLSRRVKSRVKNQGLDQLVGILKCIAKNPDKFNAGQLRVMLDAADRLAVIDQVYTATLQASSAEEKLSSTPPAVDDMLDMLRAQQSLGGTHATIESSNAGALQGVRQEMDA